MNDTPEIDRDVILDLLPLYDSGLASPATRRLVAQWLAAQGGEAPARARIARDGEEAQAELDALLRAKRLLRRQRWLFGAATGVTALCFSLEIRFGGGVPEVRLLALEHPLAFLPVIIGAALLWLGYFRLKARLRPRLRDSRFGRWAVSLPAGNLAAIAYKGDDAP